MEYHETHLAHHIEKNTILGLQKGSKLMIGFGWEFKENESIDLDGCCVVISEEGHIMDAVFYNKLLSDDNSITHSGDSKSASASHYVESITIDLTAISKNVRILGFLINSVSGASFNKCTEVDMHFIVDDINVAEIDLKCNNVSLDFNTVLMAFVYRTNENSKWKIKNITETGPGKTFMESQPLILENLKFFIDGKKLLEAAKWNAESGKSFNLNKGDIIPFPDSIQEIAIGYYFSIFIYSYANIYRREW